MPPTVRLGKGWLGVAGLLGLAALLGLVLPATMPPAAGAPAPAPLRDPQRYITQPAIDLSLRGSDLVYTRPCGQSGLFEPPSFIYWRASGATASNTVYRATTACTTAPGTPAHVGSYNVAVDSSHAYWITANGYVVRMALQPAAGAAPQSLVSGAPIALSGDPLNYWVAVDNAYVYWNQGARIYRAPKAGGSKTLLFTLPESPTRLYALGGNRLLLLQRGDGSLKVLRLDTTPYRTDTLAAGVRAYAVSTARIYWASRDGAHYVIASKSRSSLGDLQTHYRSTPNVGERVNSMAVDGSNLYWHEQSGLGTSGPIFRKALSPPNAPAQVLTANLAWVDGLVSDGSSLYWTDTAAVWRLAVNSTPLPPQTTGNIWITGAHAVQSIQVDNNLIPLLGGKPTVLRVYARSQNDTFGAWTNVIGRLEVDGSSRVRYSPGITLSTTGSNPGTMVDSFNFLLDPEDTAPGTRRFTVTIFSPTGRPETSLTDNTHGLSLTFGPERTRILHVLNYANANTGAQCTGRAPDGQFATLDPLCSQLSLYTANLLPLSRVFMETMPEVNTRSFDNSSCVAFGAARGWAGRTLDLEHREGGEWAVVFQPETQCCGGACCAGSNGNRAMSSHAIATHGTVAHEIVHSYGRVFAGHPWDAVMNYPRGEPFRVGPYYGFETSLRYGPIDGVNTFIYELMCYYHPRWSSPYTYCRLLDYSSGGTTVCDASVEGGGHLAAVRGVAPDAAGVPGARSSGITAQGMADYLYVSGAINQDGSATFDPFEIVADDKDISSPDSGQTYTLTLRNADDTVLATYQFDPLYAHTDPFTPGTKLTDPQPFSAFVLWYVDTSVIELDREGAPLISRTVSSTAPSVSLDFDPGTGALTGTHKVQWTATDADSDPLTLSVWYSPDNGTNWRLVATGLTGTATDVDFNRLPGSQSALIRVGATDGVLTGYDQSDSAFSVALKPPSVRVTVGGSVAAGDTVAAAGGASVSGQMVDATAWDPEDGVYTDPGRYTWWDVTQSGGTVVGNGYSFNSAALSPGQHVLGVEVTDDDGAGAWDDVVVDVPSTPDQGGAAASPGAGGVLQFPTALGIVLTVPPGAVGQLTHFSASLADETGYDPPRMVGRSFHISATTAAGAPVTGFSAPIALSVRYDNSLVNPADEPGLRLVTWDDGAQQWTGLGSNVDPGNNRVYANLTHLSRFALVQTAAASAGERTYLPVIRR